MFHLSQKCIGIAKALGGHFHLSVLQEGTHHRGAYVHPVQDEGVGAQYLHAQFPAISHVVIEALFAVVSEAMVITYVELTHVELLLEHGIHEIFGGERG